MDFNYLTTLSLAMIIGLVGVGALIYRSTLSSNKKDSKKIVGVIGLVAVLLALAPALGYLPDLANPIQANTQNTATIASTTVGGIVSGCAVEDTTVTFSALNKYTATATSGTHAYKVNNGPTQTVSDTGTATLSPGDSLEILWMDEAAASNYFGKVDKLTVPCKGTFTATSNLVQNGTLTFNIFNEEGNLMDTVGENETLGAGDTVALSIEVSAENKKGFPNGGVFVLEVNKSDYDEEEIYMEISGLGGRLKRVSTPESYSISSTDNIAITFEVPALEGSTKRTGTLYLDVDDTNNPGDANDPTVTFLPKDYFINEDTGASFEGPSVTDEDNAATFGHSTATTLNVD